MNFCAELGWRSQKKDRCDDRQHCTAAYACPEATNMHVSVCDQAPGLDEDSDDEAAAAQARALAKMLDDDW